MFMLFVTAGSSFYAQAQETDNQSGPLELSSARAADNLYGVSETGLYIIQLTDPAVPSYTGGIAGLEATSPQVTGERRLDADSPAVDAYIAYLHGRQDDLLADVNATLGRAVDVVFRYESALNGLAVAMSHEEAAQVSQLPGVLAVYGDTEREMTTDVGPWFLGADSIWTGNTGSGMDTRGEGIVVGIIDSGINSVHPSFAATDGDGYTHTNPYGPNAFHGWCATNPGFCNSKLIGAYGLNPAGGSPADNDGHGSHTGSTAAGNAHEAEFTVGSETYNLDISGMAPRANVVAYKVCNPGCPSTASVAAVNHAINDDEVDVLNYSISGSDFPWLDSVDLAFLEGFNAGIYISASAGNDGPGPSTVAKTGPWNASTAASTINRIIAHTVDVTGPTTPAELQGMAAVPGENVNIISDVSGLVRYNAANADGCVAFSRNYFQNAIALIIRGTCPFADKVANAAAAGAIGVIVFNNVGGPPISMGLTPANPPSVMLDDVDGAALRDYVIANPTATAVINSTTALIYNDDWENVVGGFSSRGPSQYELLAPTFIAPGVNTLAAGNLGPGDYFFSQGTSMSSPHAAGAGALIMALNPTWSPAQVRSALALTANPDDLVKEDGATPADPFDIGSGLLDLTAAGNIGLTLDETYANFVAANPAIGGDPKTLNLPALVDYGCEGECSWTRTFTSVADETVGYTAATDAPAGMTITVDPASFDIDPGETQVVEVTVDVGTLPLGSYAFGDVQLMADTDAADVHLPVVVIPAVPSDEPDIEVDPDAVSSSQAPDTISTETLTIHNNGGGDLDWEFGSGTVTTPVTLWDQQLNGTSGIVSDFFIGSNAGAYSASDFVVNDTSDIAFIFAAGFDNSDTLNVQPAINWAIYADSSGVPAGHPEDGTGMASALWAYTAPVNGPGVDITDNNIALDLIDAGEALSLTPGTYWLTVYPSYDVTGAGGPRWNWYQAAQVGAETHLVSPVIFGAPNWTPLSGLGVTFFDTAFRIEAASEFTCEHPDDVPWVSVDPTSGTTAPGGATEVTVTFDSAGLTAGTYEAVLCVDSNDPDTPVVTVPVTLTVLGNVPVIEVDPTSVESSQVPDSTATQTLTINNTGVVDLDWEIDEAPVVAIQLNATPADANAINAPISLILDDGSAEDALGLIAGGQFLWLNRFTPDPADYPIALDQVDVMFIPDTGINVGELIDIYLYEDADGNPANGATHLGSLTNQAVQAVDGATWSSYTLAAPVTFDGPGDILIAVVNRTAGVAAGTFVASIDQSSTQGRSWIGLGTLADPPVLPLATFVVVDSLGFPGNWMVRGFGEGGAAATCDSPADVPWVSVDPTSGTTAPGGATEVTVTFDSTGLSLGTYEAVLCVNSNDPETPLVEVPVTLTVIEAVPMIEVDPAAIESEQIADSSTTHTLTIDNTGQAALDWEIAEGEALAFPPITVGALVPQPAAEVDGAAAPVLSARGSDSAARWLAPEATLYDNGPLITHPGGGFGGADLSQLQTNLGLNTLGLGHAVSSGFRVADDFEVTDAAGWDVDTITFFAYQTGSGTSSTINAVNLRIWDGVPGEAGSNIVFGDTTTNLLVSSDFSNIYRATDTGPLDSSRPLMSVVAAVGTYLPQGSYWVDWQVGGTLGSGPWVAPVSILGQTNKPGANALQYDPGTATWSAALDTNSSTPQDLPFIVEGELGGPMACQPPADIPWLSVDPTSGTTAPGGSSEVTVTLDSTGLADGTYQALLCVTSNDPANPLVEVPVTLEVVPVVYGVDLSGDQADEGPVGTTVSYNMVVTNTGNAPDSFALTVDSVWDASLSATSTGVLNPGESFNFTVEVDIPADADDGDSDVATVTATSDGDDSVSDSATLTTTAVVTEPDEITLYMPLMFKND